MDGITVGCITISEEFLKGLTPRQRELKDEDIAMFAALVQTAPDARHSRYEMWDEHKVRVGFKTTLEAYRRLGELAEFAEYHRTLPLPEVKLEASVRFDDSSLAEAMTAYSFALDASRLREGESYLWFKSILRGLEWIGFSCETSRLDKHFPNWEAALALTDSEKAIVQSGRVKAADASKKTEAENADA